MAIAAGVPPDLVQISSIRLPAPGAAVTSADAALASATVDVDITVRAGTARVLNRIFTKLSDTMLGPLLVAELSNMGYDLAPAQQHGMWFAFVPHSLRANGAARHALKVLDAAESSANRAAVATTAEDAVHKAASEDVFNEIKDIERGDIGLGAKVSRRASCSRRTARSMELSADRPPACPPAMPRCLCSCCGSHQRPRRTRLPDDSFFCDCRWVCTCLGCCCSSAAAAGCSAQGLLRHRTATTISTCPARATPSTTTTRTGCWAARGASAPAPPRCPWRS
jgi:hypothetical protein